MLWHKFINYFRFIKKLNIKKRLINWKFAYYRIQLINFFFEIFIHNYLISIWWSWLHDYFKLIIDKFFSCLNTDIFYQIKIFNNYQLLLIYPLFLDRIALLTLLYTRAQKLSTLIFHNLYACKKVTGMLIFYQWNRCLLRVHYQNKKKALQFLIVDNVLELA